MRVIFISGKIGSGKDTTAAIIKRLLEERGCYVKLTAFADSLKKTVAFLQGEDVGVYYTRDGKDKEKNAFRRRLIVSVGEAATKVDPFIFARKTCNDALDDLKGKKKAILIVTDLRKTAEWDYSRQGNDTTALRLKGSYKPCPNEDIANSPIECELDYLDNLLAEGQTYCHSELVTVFKPYRTFIKDSDVGAKGDLEDACEANRRNNIKHLKDFTSRTLDLFGIN